MLIDLNLHKELWEDISDAAIAEERAEEPRESLEDVKKLLAEH